MLSGGVSDPRNRGLMKMFNLIDIGERAGSGIPRIMNIWSDEGMIEPVIKEEFDPDRTILTLSLVKKQLPSTADDMQNEQPQVSRKTLENRKKILDYLKDNGRSRCTDIAKYLGLSEVRTRAILSTMSEVEILGSNKNREYRIK